MPRQKVTSLWEVELPQEVDWDRDERKLKDYFTCDNTTTTCDNSIITCDYAFDLLDISSLWDSNRYDRFIFDLYGNYVLDLDNTKVVWISWNDENILNTKWD